MPENILPQTINGENFNMAQITELLSAYGLRLLAAVAIFVIGKWVVKRIVTIVRKMMEHAKIDKTLVSFAGNLTYALLMAFIVIAALSQLGIETTSLAAVLAAAGLAVGLALQGSLSNFAAGVMIILFRPFRIGDYVEAGGTAGTVEDIAIFTTIFKTPDNKKVIVPNNNITSGIITNYSAKPTRRIDLVFGVSYGDDLSKIKKVLTKLVSEDERILKDPEPVIAVKELADSSVNLICRPWVKSADYGPVSLDLTEKVKTTFDKEGISIPFPQQDMHIVTSDAKKMAAE